MSFNGLVMASDDPVERPPWMPAIGNLEGKPPPWNQDEGDLLVGQYLLAGITYVASDEKTVTSQVQCHGRITRADEGGISFVCEGVMWPGETATLPADLRAFQPARPGEYRLRSTGEIVNDPDIVTSWTITEPSKPS